MNTPSTENLDLIPGPKNLKQICQSISALEAIIYPDWEYRYFSYQKDWSKNEECCGMKNGQGDRLLILFSDKGVCINGFAHESEMNGWTRIQEEKKQSLWERLFGESNELKAPLTQIIPKGVVEDLPDVFNEFIFGEPVKSIGTTFCIWRTKLDNEWKTGKINLPSNEYKDGSRDLLQLLDGKPDTFKEWAEDYYEEDFDERKLQLELVEKVYNRTTITQDIVRAINPSLEDFDKLRSDLDEIGYEHHF